PPPRIVRYDQELLESYRQALAVAVEISATHNVPPLPGRTAILCCVDHNMGAPCVSARALHVPRSRTPEEVEEAKAWKSPVILEVAILLALMTRHVSEHAELVLFNSNTYCLLQLDSGGLLANVDRVLQEAQ
ncbi:hypothetical protein chiPu_0030612, partial [Chiloscyllium punctatum]|nr:hypothetical protein [Chiloscyllium punctatum]